MHERERPEFEFLLPKGLVINDACYTRGKMRLATGRDELAAREHPLARESSQFSWLVLLSRVIARLENLPELTPEQIGLLPLADSLYLKQFYRQLDPWQGDDVPLGEPRSILPIACFGRWRRSRFIFTGLWTRFWRSNAASGGNGWSRSNGCGERRARASADEK